LELDQAGISCFVKAWRAIRSSPDRHERGSRYAMPSSRDSTRLANVAELEERWMELAEALE